MKKIFATISLLTTICLQAQQPLCFTESTVTPVSQPQALVGDFNNDGFDDIVVLAGSALLFGQGNGSFTQSPTFGLPIGPYNVKLADFNGDGNLDMSMQSFVIPGILFSFGDGLGGFLRDTLVVPALASYVARDFDGDGKCDVFITHSSALAPQIYRSVGTGSFLLVNTLNSFTNTTTLAFEDFNGDSYIDIFSFVAGNAVIYPGNQSIIYTSSVSVPGISSSVGLQFNDFDKDGKTDIFIIGTGIITKKALNNFVFGSTAFSLGSTQFTNTVYFADLNSDGKDDILWIGNNNNLSYALNTGLGFSAASSYYLLYSPGFLVTSIGTCDFNGDSKDDLLVVTTDPTPWCTAIVLINCNETGIDEKLKNDFKIYPQPASHNIIIQVEGLDINGAQFFELFNAVGSRMDLSAKVSHNKVEVDVSDLPNGIYFLSISNNNQQALIKRKITIEHW